MLKINFSILISNYAGTPTNKSGAPLNNNNNSINNSSNNNQNNIYNLPCGAAGCMIAGTGSGAGTGVGMGAITASPSGRRKRQQELQVCVSCLAPLVSTRVIFACALFNLTLFSPSHCMTTNSKLNLNSNNSNNSENNFPFLLPCEPLLHLQLAGL